MQLGVKAAPQGCVRRFSIFPTTKICLPDSGGPGAGGAAGQRPADLPADMGGARSCLREGYGPCGEHNTGMERPPCSICLVFPLGLELGARGVQLMHAHNVRQRFPFWAGDRERRKPLG